MTALGHGALDARAAADAVRARLCVREPVMGVILGTGLGDLADRIGDAKRMPFGNVPGFQATSVTGHRGELIHGMLGGREVLALAGRFHMYEGHSARVSAYPVRVLHALGVRVLFTSNAAGGIRPAFAPGDLMIIADQLNLTWRNPLTGPLEPGDVRFPDMSSPYAPRLVALLRDSAAAVDVRVVAGVYAGLLGPAYETAAEVRMLGLLGADAVGMSTVAETIVAAALGMEVAGISLITNAATGLSAMPVSHAEVVASGVREAGRFADLVTEFARRL